MPNGYLGFSPYVEKRVRKFRRLRERAGEKLDCTAIENMIAGHREYLLRKKPAVETEAAPVLIAPAPTLTFSHPDVRP